MLTRDILCLALPVLALLGGGSLAAAEDRPHILLAISDDQSFAHTSAAGYAAVSTPAFDRVAREGVLLTQAFCGSPGCSPSRASLLTGRYPWQLEQAGTHASSFPARYAVYPDLLEAAGYFVGYTGKGWGPGNWQAGGRQRNPAGPAFNRRKLPTRSPSGVSGTDYAGNFADFLAQRPAGRPFCFWYGGHEPHRGFHRDSGVASGKREAEATVPPFLPAAPEVRRDLLDYCLEIEHFDRQLGKMISLLEEAGELDNTLIVVTSDNGMAFPRAKANCYEYGVHVPMAVRWPGHVTAGRRVDDLVSFVDLAPTFLAAAELEPPAEMVGRSLLALLGAAGEGIVETQRDAVYSARERHSSSRYNNWTYPQRAIRTHDYLLVRNFRPERWPAGAPQKFDAPGRLGPPHGGYHDIDGSPTLSFLIRHRDDEATGRFFHLAVDKRPGIELFDIRRDPGCLNNLAGDSAYAQTRDQLLARLEAYLRKTGDPRVLDGGEVFESYRRYSPIREFPAPPD